ncbi:hypothetical protein Lalb_Chr10g0093011 [Lupinus albus]|uniref:Uncharacterized protein n=1 Tax=Lupinus albus TaxID=3870 RepID=A0A6A4PUI1_LUPAL|nr:hypothetical protein Lalb_Chr10g0093011 [Lupinus albus]
MPLLSTSSVKQNKKGDKGLPCLTPFLQLKKSMFLPLMLIQSLANCIIQLIQVVN